MTQGQKEIAEDISAQAANFLGELAGKCRLRMETMISSPGIEQGTVDYVNALENILVFWGGDEGRLARESQFSHTAVVEWLEGKNLPKPSLRKAYLRLCLPEITADMMSDILAGLRAPTGRIDII